VWECQISHDGSSPCYKSNEVRDMGLLQWWLQSLFIFLWRWTWQVSSVTLVLMIPLLLRQVLWQNSPSFLATRRSHLTSSPYGGLRAYLACGRSSCTLLANVSRANIPTLYAASRYRNCVWLNCCDCCLCT